MSVMAGTPTFRRDATPTVATAAVFRRAGATPTTGHTAPAQAVAGGLTANLAAAILRQRARINSRASAANGFGRLREPRDTVELELEAARSPAIPKPSGAMRGTSKTARKRATSPCWRFRRSNRLRRRCVPRLPAKPRRDYRTSSGMFLFT